MPDIRLLMDAVRKNNADIVGAYILKGGNVHVYNDAGNTALHAAAYYGHKDVAEVLLKAGADMHKENKDGVSSLAIAADKVIHPAPDDSGERAMELLALFINSNADKMKEKRKDVIDALEEDDDSPISAAPQEKFSDDGGVLEAINDAVYDEDADGKKAKVRKS